MCRVLVAILTTATFCCLALSGVVLAGEKDKEKDKKGEEGRKGTTIGVLVSKGENVIELKADGEEKGRKYVPQWVGGAPAQGGGFDKAMLKTFKELKVGSRIQVDWIFEERLRALNVKVLKAADKEEKKGSREQTAAVGDKKDTKEDLKLPKDVKSAKAVGVLTAKGKNFIELKADGSETPRKYFLHFGGTKKLLHAIQDIPVGSRVQIEWAMIEHYRVLDMELIKGADKK
jgi:hypothetical protein